MAKKLNVRRSEEGKKIPTGVKAVSILFYLGAVLCAIMAISMIFGANTIITSILASNPGMGLESIPQGMMITVIIVIGILAVGAGVFSFFIGRGLWKLKQWARITAIVLSMVGFLSVLISIILHFQLTQILSFLIDGFIGCYLLFSDEAKEAFK